jgi:hypothetical protein
MNAEGYRSEGSLHREPIVIRQSWGRLRQKSLRVPAGPPRERVLDVNQGDHAPPRAFSIDCLTFAASG